MPAMDPPTNPDKGVISITGLSLKLEFKAPALLEMVTAVQEAPARPRSYLHYTWFPLLPRCGATPYTDGACDV